MSNFRKCRACGDGVDVAARRVRLNAQGISVATGELYYCRECADELFRDKISSKPARLFSAGGGCPLEPSDDASPWQANAIRELERDG